MNEQLIIKNFGPFQSEEVEVTFKRISIFIGPTGGGKSTLVKLAATFKDASNYLRGQGGFSKSLIDYNISEFASEHTSLYWHSTDISARFYIGRWQTGADGEMADKMSEAKKQIDAYGEEFDRLSDLVNSSNVNQEEVLERVRELLQLREEKREFFKQTIAPNKTCYFPSERILLSTLDASWPDLIKEQATLPATLLDFAKQYLQAREKVNKLNLTMLGVGYQHEGGRDVIKLLNGSTIPLTVAASGIQSVTPLLVLLEHLSRNTEQAQSFIIEEPELNLYPTAQQGLLNWLVEKCTKGENDLTITTHSPYILSSCNLLLEAYKVAQLRPDLEEEIAAIVPKACWLNPDEFAAYYVADGTVKPITDERTHLIGGNELDAVSGDISDSFRKLLRLKKQAV
jgi:predicted ATPase